MNTTPVYGWPYAEDDDPVKQFPTAVDQPRTLAIETSLSTHDGRDTGWREIGALLANGFAGSVTIRRTGWLVTVSCYDVTRASAVANPGVAIIPNAPAGFAGSPQMYLLTRTNLWNASTASVMANSSVGIRASAASWLWAFVLPAGGRVFETFTYPTGDAWPTTLPGVPAAVVAPAD